MKELRNYLLENKGELLETVRGLNAWNGSLEHLEFYENEEITFNDIFYSVTPYEFMTKYNFNDYFPGDDYFKINYYGDVISYSEYEMFEEIEIYIDEVIESLLESYYEIETSVKLTELIENVLEE